MRKIANENLNRLTEQEFKQAKKRPISIVLDNVRSMQNVGSIFRTADAFLIEKIYLCGITATPPHRDILKTALGATETIDWEFKQTTKEAIDELKLKNIHIAAIEQVENSTSLEQKRWTGEPIALIFGHEVNGVSQEIVDLADESIEIPQWGSKHSFNISVSAGIVLWQLVSSQLK